MELIARLNAVVTLCVTNELATAERSRSLPWTEEQENAARAAYLARRLATGAYPRLAAGIAGSAGAVDMEAMFERMLGRVLDGFDPGS
jgi:hypothetical protein